MEEKIEIKHFYTINEFAKKLQVHPNTIRRHIKNALISAFKFGSDKRSTYRIPHSEIERIMIFNLKEKIIDHMRKNNEI